MPGALENLLNILQWTHILPDEGLKMPKLYLISLIIIMVIFKCYFSGELIALS